MKVIRLFSDEDGEVYSKHGHDFVEVIRTRDIQSAVKHAVEMNYSLRDAKLILEDEVSFTTSEHCIRRGIAAMKRKKEKKNEALQTP